MSLGKFTAAAAAVQIENSAALANLNVDFTLFKLQAPEEYRSLGPTLSRKRKLEAEDGNLHKTARKLGALFESSLPPSQALFKAYGKRVSEIAAMPLVNPRGSVRHGMFADQIGLDSTTIWAAATSGSGAIAVHLLACMLARMFTPTEATAIWVELVEQQKMHIYQGCAEDLYAAAGDRAMLATRQDISRTDLANWDSSARAWVHSADQAKASQHKQMMLILENASIPINNEKNTYKSVMKAWSTALVAMNSLILGMPQQVRDGAALLGISSWHMYPDMVVLGGKTVDVEQRDSLFGDTAVLTLGLEIRGDRSVSWSLPLARLQYYGKPVPIERTAGQDNSRLTPEEFAYVVLGCVFACWNDFASTFEIGLSWVRDIAELVRRTKRPEGNNPAAELGWIAYLGKAASQMLTADEVEKQLALQLMALGRRRRHFINPTDSIPPPLFGLSDVQTLMPLLKDSLVRVNFLRDYASKLKLAAANYAILYTDSYTGSRPLYATLAPIGRQSLKRTHEGDVRDSGPHMKHARWILFNLRELNDLCRNPEGDLPGAEGVIEMRKALETIGEDCFPAVILSGMKKSTVFGHGDNFSSAAISLQRRLSEDVGSLGNVNPTFVLGNEQSAAIVTINPHLKVKQYPNLILNSKQLGRVFNTAYCNEHTIFNHLLGFGVRLPAVQHEIRMMNACGAIAAIYNLLPGATISTLVLSQPLSYATWIPASLTKGETVPSLSLSQTFACISMLDTGTCYLDPMSLREVFAVSSGNSLYVAGALLCDPYQEPKPTEVKRVVGNIGRAGVSLLVPPSDPKIHEVDNQNWREVNHLPFRGEAADCFGQTSIHISFTEYEMPLKTDTETRHIIDRPIRLLETLVQVHDRGRWIADLDVLGSFTAKSKTLDPRVTRFKCAPQTEAERQICSRKPRLSFEQVTDGMLDMMPISIDNWDELLDPPQGNAIIARAHKNWLSRLALTTICSKLGFQTIVLGNEVCWQCCCKVFKGRACVKNAAVLEDLEMEDADSPKSIDSESPFDMGVGNDEIPVEESSIDPNPRDSERRMEEEAPQIAFIY